MNIQCGQLRVPILHNHTKQKLSSPGDYTRPSVTRFTQAGPVIHARSVARVDGERVVRRYTSRLLRVSHRCGMLPAGRAATPSIR